MNINRVSKRFSPLKKAYYFVVLALLSISLMTSCKKDDSSSSANVDDVADNIASSVGSSNSGLSSEMEQVTKLMKTSKSLLLKSTQADTLYRKDSTFSLSNSANALITYNYTFNFKYGYVYALNSLSNIYCNTSINGSFDAPRLSSTDSRTGKWVLTGLAASSNSYILNGTVAITGSSKSKVRNKSTATSVSDVTVTNVKINKTTSVITEGTLNWVTKGQINGQTYAYTATVVYKGSGKADVTINGTTYTVSLASGQVD